MKTALLSLFIAGAIAPSVLQEASKPAAQNAPRETVVVKATNIKWGDHPSVQGAKMCVQSGDPTQGPSVLLMKFPKGTTVNPHWHTSDETTTVVSGSALFGTGEVLDAAKGIELSAGCYMLIPGKNPHWVIVKEEFVISVTLDKPADFHLCGEKK